MRIGIGADHGGFVLKEAVIKAIESLGHEYKDYGTYSERILRLSRLCAQGGGSGKKREVDRGILLCGTGIGICIATNKVKGIRCGHVTDVFSAKATAAHNDANIISMGGRITSPELAQEIVKAYLTTPFESEQAPKAD